MIFLFFHLLDFPLLPLEISLQLIDLYPQPAIFLMHLPLHSQFLLPILAELKLIAFDLAMHDLKKAMGYFLIDDDLIEVAALLNEILYPEMQVVVGVGEFCAAILEVVDGHDEHYFPAVGDGVGLGEDEFYLVEGQFLLGLVGLFVVVDGEDA